MQAPELTRADLSDLAQYHLDLRTPWWFYVLREAAAFAEGKHLGPVGGQIVAEILVASSTATASPTAHRIRNGRRPTAATTHSQWRTYSPPRA